MNEAPTTRELVIVGNGMATGRLLDELLARDGQRFKITVIGAEPIGSYNRIMLSSVLAKDADVQGIIQKDHAWYDAHDIRFQSGSAVTKIDRKAKCVLLENGQSIAYDELVLATGSSAARIPAKNHDLDNVFTFRTVADTHAMMDIATTAKHALVVGGGLLGLEAAYGLAKFGIKVTLVHRSAWLLNRQLDKPAAAMLQSVMSNMNIEFILSDEVDSFNSGKEHGEETLESVTLKSGTKLDVQLAVVATGITPNAQIGIDAGLDGQRAIAVDDFMHTSADHISAVGECVEHRGQTFGLVDPLWRHAETLAARLIEQKNIPFENQAIATKLKVSGVQVFSAGLVETNPEVRALTLCDKKANIYRKLLIKDGCIVGIVLFGDVRSGQYYFDLMQSKTDVSDLLPALIIGEAFLATPDKNAKQKTMAA